MNYQIIRKILNSYKSEFKQIHDREIYKWRAVKCFQDNWKIRTGKFYFKLEKALEQTANLLESGHYFPRRMILALAKKNPTAIKEMFNDLFDEEKDLKERIEIFQNKAKRLNNQLFPGTNDYQDLRAVMAYLVLMFPDTYYFYKFRMFKEFASIIGHPTVPSMGRIESVMHYHSLCERLKEEILKDNQLIKLHKGRVSDNEYFDQSCNILTQDVIWFATNRYNTETPIAKQLPASRRLLKVSNALSPKRYKVMLQGTSESIFENNIEKKNIGDAGEDLVMEWEQEKLKRFGIKKKPEHISRSRGDGFGYDILSYDRDGEQMFIEVKTTKSGPRTPFYITVNELVCSKKKPNNYYLYRLFNFEPGENRAKMIEEKGSLEKLCINPTQFRVLL